MIQKVQIEQLSEKIDNLNSSDNFSIELDFIDPPKSNKELAKVLKKQSLPKELLEFYSVCDGIFITTETQGFSKKMAYSFELRSADLIFEHEVGLNDNLSDLNLPDNNFLVLDILAVPGNYVIGYVTEQDLLELYLITFSKHLNKLNLSFTAYLEKSIEYLGIDLWQQFYIDQPSNISDYYIYDTLYDSMVEKGIAEFPIDKINSAKSSCQLIAVRNKYDFTNLLNHKLDFIKEKGAIVNNTNDFIWGALASHLMKARETIGLQLSDFVVAFYDQVDGVDIDWSIDNGPSGQLNLEPIAIVLGGVDYRISQKWGSSDIHQKIIWTGEEDDLAFYKQNFLLEKYIGDSGFTSFSINKDGKALINYVTDRSTICKTSMPLEKYLEIHIAILGCWHWLSIVGKGPTAKVGDSLVSSEINQIFPDFKIDQLLPPASESL